MAETAPNTEQWPHGVEMYDSIELKKPSKFSRKKIPVGILDVEGEKVDVPLSSEHVLASWGYDPRLEAPKVAESAKKEESKEKLSQKGKWNRKFDPPADVTITGEGEPLVEGDIPRETWRTEEFGDIPKDEVHFEAETISRTEVTPEPIQVRPDPVEITPDPELNPELQKLQQEVKELREEVGRLTGLLAEALEQNKALQKQLAEAKGEEGGPQSDEVFAEELELEFPIGSRVKAPNKKGEMQENWRVASKPEKTKKSEEKILLVDIEGKLLRVTPDQLREWNSEGFVPPAVEEKPATEGTVESPTAEVEPESPEDKNEERLHKRLQRKLKEAKARIYGWHANLKTGGVETEEEKRERRGILGKAVAAVALFGAGALVFWLGTKTGADGGHDEILKQIGGLDKELDTLGDQMNNHDESMRAEHGIGHSPDGQSLTEQHQDLSQEHNDLDEDIHSYAGGSSTEDSSGSSNSDVGEGNGGENSSGSQSEDGKNETQIGQDFKVEYGNGVTHEIQQYAQANGINISNEDAFRFYEQLEASQHDRIIDLHGTPADSYWHVDPQSGPEVRIASPGTANWYPEAELQLRTALGLS